ncbi:MAG: hypothetical protein JNN27_00485 [Planctomycetes bacterium]|nr:hypothetical protein [Planctomycetota bacterium]
MGTPSDLAVRRAALPELCFAPDLAPVLLVDEQVVERLLADGRLGRTLRVRGLRAVLRDDFLDALAAAAETDSDVVESLSLQPRAGDVRQ